MTHQGNPPPVTPDLLEDVRATFEQICVAQQGVFHSLHSVGQPLINLNGRSPHRGGVNVQDGL